VFSCFLYFISWFFILLYLCVILYCVVGLCCFYYVSSVYKIVLPSGVITNEYKKLKPLKRLKSARLHAVLSHFPTLKSVPRSSRRMLIGPRNEPVRGRTIDNGDDGCRSSSFKRPTKLIIVAVLLATNVAVMTSHGLRLRSTTGDENSDDKCDTKTRRSSVSVL